MFEQVLAELREHREATTNEFRGESRNFKTAQPRLASDSRLYLSTAPSRSVGIPDITAIAGQHDDPPC